MKYTIFTTAFIFALVSSKAVEYSDLSDDTFCKYVGTWVDRAEALTPGFKWNIDQICKNGKYEFETPGMFCDVLIAFYGDGESWCSSYANCQKISDDECHNKVIEEQLGELVDCPEGTYIDDNT